MTDTTKTIKEAAREYAENQVPIIDWGFDYDDIEKGFVAGAYEMRNRVIDWLYHHLNDTGYISVDKISFEELIKTLPK